jgi:hypothetical protein
LQNESGEARTQEKKGEELRTEGALWKKGRGMGKGGEKI